MNQPDSNSRMLKSREPLDEQRMIDRYEEEMNDYFLEELGALTVTWTEAKESREMAKIQSQFSDVLTLYEQAKEKQNPAIFDKYLWKDLPRFEMQGSKGKVNDILETLQTLIKHGAISYEKSIKSSDLKEQSQQRSVQQKSRLGDKLRNEGQRKWDDVVVVHDRNSRTR